MDGAIQQYERDTPDDIIDLSWIGDQKKQVISKVAFFNSCGFCRRILFSLTHGRNFRPTENEKKLYYYFKNGVEE